MTKCDRCMWKEQCAGDDPCEDYSPLEQDCDEVIEQMRYEFYDAWSKYISEMGDRFIF